MDLYFVNCPSFSFSRQIYISIHFLVEIEKKYCDSRTYKIPNTCKFNLNFRDSYILFIRSVISHILKCGVFFLTDISIINITYTIRQDNKIEHIIHFNFLFSIYIVFPRFASDRMHILNNSNSDGLKKSQVIKRR